MAQSRCRSSSISLVLRGRFLYVLFYHTGYRFTALNIETPVKFTISSPTQAVIVLSQLGRRHFYQISGKVYWTMDFVLVKEGESVPLAPSLHSTFFQRSVSLEIELEEGTYLVYVRLDRDYGKNSDLKQVKEDQLRKLSRLLTQRATGRTVAKSMCLPTFTTAY